MKSIYRKVNNPISKRKYRLCQYRLNVFMETKDFENFIFKKNEWGTYSYELTGDAIEWFKTNDLNVWNFSKDYTYNYNSEGNMFIETAWKKLYNIKKNDESYEKYRCLYIFGYSSKEVAMKFKMVWC